MRPPTEMRATLLLRLLPVLAVAAAAPVRYDQRQEGDFNVHAHLENFVLVLIPTASNGGGGLGIVDLLKKAGASVRTADEPVQVAVVKVRPEDPPHEQQDGQLQREAQGAEDLQTAAAAAPPEAVLVAESPAIVLARAGAVQQPPAEATASDGARAARAVARGFDAPRDCPQGYFRDATGVCHEIGSDRRIDDGVYLGLMPPFEK